MAPFGLVDILIDQFFYHKSILISFLFLSKKIIMKVAHRVAHRVTHRVAHRVTHGLAHGPRPRFCPHPFLRALVRLHSIIVLSSQRFSVH